MADHNGLPITPIQSSYYNISLILSHCTTIGEYEIAGLPHKYKIEGLPPGRAHTHKSPRLKALVTALLELIAHTHDDDDDDDDDGNEDK